VTCHGHPQRLGFEHRLLRQEERVERSVGFHKLPLKDAKQ
jgi:hypothetical protein